MPIRRSQACLKLRNHALTVSVVPAFGAKWLVPRLDHFYAEYPGTDVRVDARTRLVDPLREDIDLCIRYGWGNYPGPARGLSEF